MKKIRFILPVMAFIFAIIGAFATSSSQIVAPDYIMVSGNCQEISLECSDSGTPICQYNINPSGPVDYRDVFESRIDGTHCDVVLRHNENNGKLN